MAKEKMKKKVSKKTINPAKEISLDLKAKILDLKQAIDVAYALDPRNEYFQMKIHLANVEHWYGRSVMG